MSNSNKITKPSIISDALDKSYELGEQSGRGQVISAIFKYVTENPGCSGLDILKLINGMKK